MDLTASSSTSSTDNFLSKTKLFGTLVNGEHTDVALTNFPNYQNLIITQFEKIGNLYQVRIDQPENGLTVVEPVYNITPILGAENIQAEVAIRYLADKLKIKKPLLICLSLKNYSRSSVDSIIQSILNYP